MLAHKYDPRDENFPVFDKKGKKIGVIWMRYFRDFFLSSKRLRQELEDQMKDLEGNSLFGIGLAHLDGLVSLPIGGDLENSPEMIKYNTLINEGRILTDIAIQENAVSRATVNFIGKFMGHNSVPFFSKDSEAIREADRLIQEAYEHAQSTLKSK